MTITLKALKDQGFIADKKPIKKLVKFEIDGKQHQFYVGVVVMTVGDQDSVFNAQRDHGAAAAVISACIRLGEQFDEQISVQDAKRLTPPVAGAFLSAINEVNSPAKDESKN